MEDKSIDALERILQFTATYGLAVVFLCLFLLGMGWVFYETVVFLRKWAPQVAKGHVDLLDTLKEATEIQTSASTKTANALDTLSRTRSEQDAKTHRVLRHFAVAAKESTGIKEAQYHLDEALRELGSNE